MKKINFRLTIAFGALFIFGFITPENADRPSSSKTPSLPAPVTMCGSFVADWSDSSRVESRLWPGLGDLHYGVTTSSKDAQQFFDQGIRLVYGFNHWEAIRSFRQAIRLDPQFAMAYWGLALGFGPNLNDVNPKDREALAFEAVSNAKSKSSGVTNVEKDLINALSKRYDGQAHDDRSALNQAYADAMILLAKKYPDDAEVQTQTADAIMNTMPWDYWEKDGTPKPATKEAKVILENTLRKFPQHVGAHHLYIHLVEASADPAQALNSASVLETAMPAAGHIVHMPAHIYLRTGQYDRAIELNQKAAVADENYLALSGNRGMYRFAYYPHNIDFISYGSYMEGRSKLGIETALRLAYKGNMITGSNPVFSQYFAIEPLIAYTRFGKWNEILSLEEPDDDRLYAQVLYRFAKGLALIRTGETDRAKIELTKLDSIAKLDTLKTIYATFNAVGDIAQVPLHLLRGEVLLKSGKTEDGIQSLIKAVEAEENLRYMEPPDWKLPSRQYLGTAYFNSGNYQKAEETFRADLKKNPRNGWTLQGLKNSQSKLGKKIEAAESEKLFSQVWKNADIKINAAVY